MDAMVIGDSDAPIRQQGEALIRVSAVGLNYPDALYCTGDYHDQPDLPFVPGLEVCGRVVDVDVGEDLENGVRIVAFTEPPCGSFAEFTTVRAAHALQVPAAMDDITAAGMFGTYQTAHLGLRRRAALDDESTLLVLGASGGVGSAAVDIGTALGARVVAVTSGVQKATHCRELGAEVVLDRQIDDIREATLDLTQGRGVDVVFDPVGGTAFDTARRCLAFEGRYVVIGFAGGGIPSINIGHVLVKNVAIVGLHASLYRHAAPTVIRAAHEELMNWWIEGRITPVIQDVVPFDAIPSALDELLSRSRWGKTVALGVDQLAGWDTFTQPRTS